jgi:sugar (pentulose or hexulose) kinase
VGQAILEACLVGGGAASVAWGQLISDVTGLTLEVPEVIEASALGAAICAGVVVGVLEDIRSASQQLVRIARKHSPDPLRAVRYQRAFDAYVRIDDALASESAASGVTLASRVEERR